jgi:hypothetical protein
MQTLSLLTNLLELVILKDHPLIMPLMKTRLPKISINSYKDFTLLTQNSRPDLYILLVNLMQATTFLLFQPIFINKTTQILISLDSLLEMDGLILTCNIQHTTNLRIKINSLVRPNTCS